MAARVLLACCTSNKTPRKPDSKWSWLACAAGTIAWALCFGLVNCYAVIMPVIMDQFNTTREDTAWAGSIPSSLAFATIPACSKVVSRIDIRLGALVGAGMCLLSLVVTSYTKSLLQMFFSYSILYGLGCSMLFTSIVVAMTKYFKKRQGIALGFVSGGLNLGILTLGPLIQVLIDSYGYRSMFRILASMLVAVLLFLLSFDPNVQKETIVTDGEPVEQEEREVGFIEGLKHLVRRPIYIIAVVSLILQTMTAFVTHVHLISYCKEVGIAPPEASNLFIAIGLSSLVSSVIAGRVIDIPTVDPIHVNQVASFTLALSMLLLQLATKYYHFVIYSIFLGLGCGILVTTIVLVLLRTVEPRLRSVSFPFGQMLVSIGNLTGPPLIGFIADKTGSYKPAFYTAGGICLVAFFINFLQYCFKPCRKQPGNMSISLDECERDPLNPTTNETEPAGSKTECTTENDLLAASVQNPEPTNKGDENEIHASNNDEGEAAMDDMPTESPSQEFLPSGKKEDETMPLLPDEPASTESDKENELPQDKDDECNVLIPTSATSPDDPENKHDKMAGESEPLQGPETTPTTKPAGGEIEDNPNGIPVVKETDKPDVQPASESTQDNLAPGDAEEQDDERLEAGPDETSDTSPLSPD